MLTKANIKVVYSSGEDEPIEFFFNALLESTSFDLCLGYFSTSGFRALSLGFAYFISKGGKMRIIINDVLSQQDKDAIENGLYPNIEELVQNGIIEDILSLEKTLSSHGIHFFNCISWLVSSKKLEIIAISPLNNNIGIAHNKFGIFKDAEGNSVAFNGSANFSSTALFNNLESITCSKSWTNEPSEIDRVVHFENLFEKIWSGNSHSVQIIPTNRIKVAIRERFPVSSINELLFEENLLIDSTIANRLLPSSYITRLETLRQLIKDQYEISEKENRKSDVGLQKPIKLYEYQKLAIQKWVENDYKGLFMMATGTGKTFTALGCAKYLLDLEGHINLFVLVPTIDLANQWLEETKLFLLRNIIIANSKNTNWYNEAFVAVNHAKKNSFCIISTYATFLTQRFQAIINIALPTSFLIADEAHNFGTQKHVFIYPEKIQRRLGLSATPDRYFDEEGTKAIFKYFNAEQGPTFEYTMGEAIANGYLCEYYYYPLIASLSKEELEEYKVISKKLLQFFDKKSGRFSDNPIVTTLLIKRKRIIHNAVNKFDILRNILTELIANKKPLRYVLVYVPEGNEKKIDTEDQKLINEYSRIITNDFGLSQHQFIGITKNRESILNAFANGKIAVLTAMKCLDEGVDIKRAEIAIFCSSTGNPRQFIQRRGRILRTHPDKKFATIYDMVVVPNIDDLYSGDNLQMERSILQGELRRVHEFAGLALNHYQALKVLEDVANKFDIDIYSKS